MLLEEQLLSDYGNIPQKIGMFLLQSNASSFVNIKNATGLSDIELRDGLSILIQRRFVNFFVFERTIKYYFDSQLLKRRLYFPIYLRYMIDNYSAKHTKYFSDVLISGIYKDAEDTQIIDNLLNDNILQVDMTRSGKGSSKNIQRVDFDQTEHDGNEIAPKVRKFMTRYLIVNYDYLDQKIYEQELVKYTVKRYNEAAGDVLKAIFKCNRIDRNSIIKNLENCKILIEDNGVLVNEKDNINEYLRYLVFGGIVQKGMDESRAYFVTSCVRLLKTHKINLMIKNPEARRIFNMISTKGIVDDKDITMYSLLSVNRIKRSLFELQRVGLLLQKCNNDYKTGVRMEHSWAFDIDFASRSILMKLEETIYEKLKAYNSCWDVNYFMDNADGNENVWVSDIINLSTDHLIFNLN